MAAYVLVEIEITDPVRYEEYKLMAPRVVESFGGKYLVRGGRTETLEGKRIPKRLVILQFDSFDRAEAWWSSQDYAAAKKLRQDCTITEMILVEGVPPGFKA